MRGDRDHCGHPSARGGLGLLGSVPMGLLAYRYRLRVLITATVAAGVIGFLVVGLSGVGAVVLCAYVGGLAGIVKRHRRGTPTSSRRPLSPASSSAPRWSSR